MNFTDAVKTCFSKYADFTGRASRPEYWWFFLFIVVGSILLSFIWTPLSWVFYLGVIVPSLAAAARRLHDTDRSGWFQLIGFIPLIGLVLLYFLALPPKEPNRF
jgi:uncharacterized membrane protein YhaH (DUF805 family)